MLTDYVNMEHMKNATEDFDSNLKYRIFKMPKHCIWQFFIKQADFEQKSIENSKILLSIKIFKPYDLYKISIVLVKQGLSCLAIRIWQLQSTIANTRCSPQMALFYKCIFRGTRHFNGIYHKISSKRSRKGFLKQKEDIWTHWSCIFGRIVENTAN